MEYKLNDPIPNGGMESQKLISLLQLADSAFPIGGFSHSLGLEAYVQQHGIGRHKNDQKALTNAFIWILENSGSLNLPFVRAAHVTARSGEPEQKSEETIRMSNAENEIYTLTELDNLCEACTTNHIANRASIKQGKSLLEVSSFIHNHLPKSLRSDLMKLSHCHYPVVYGAVLAGIGLDENSTLASFMFGVARSVIATAIRLDVLGAMEGQKVQYSLQQDIPEIIDSFGLDTEGNLKRGNELQFRRERLLRSLVPEIPQTWELENQAKKVMPPLRVMRVVMDVKDATHHSWPWQTVTESQNIGWFADPKRLPRCQRREWAKHYRHV